MEFVETLKEIKANIKVIDGYLNGKDETEKEYAVDLVKRGFCFVAVKTDEGYKFYPSRFIGYADNSKEKHEMNFERDGRDTNPVISRIIGSKLVQDAELEEAYKEYCNLLGFKSYKRKRKYWRI